MLHPLIIKGSSFQLLISSKAHTLKNLAYFIEFIHNKSGCENGLSPVLSFLTLLCEAASKWLLLHPVPLDAFPSPKKKLQNINGAIQTTSQLNTDDRIQQRIHPHPIIPLVGKAPLMPQWTAPPPSTVTYCQWVHIILLPAMIPVLTGTDPVPAFPAIPARGIQYMEVIYNSDVSHHNAHQGGTFATHSTNTLMAHFLAHLSHPASAIHSMFRIWL